MIQIDERFIKVRAAGFGIDKTLPFRLQKRLILKILGFPLDPNLIPCPALAQEKVKGLMEIQAQKGYPYLIIVSEKPIRAIVPPLFVVQGEEIVNYRGVDGLSQIIAKDEVLSECGLFPAGTWLEFGSLLWNKNAFAGRIVYQDFAVQMIELQKGVRPAEILISEESPVYSGKLHFFDIKLPDYQQTTQRLKERGYYDLIPFGIIKTVAGIFSNYFEGFAQLKGIAPLPTVEFAITKEGALICVDVDWPDQFIIIKRRVSP